MKYIAVLIALSLPFGSTAQNLEVDGKVKVLEMDTITTGTTVVVRSADGTLAERPVLDLIINYFLNLPNGIQALLNAGECPLRLLDAGVPIDSLYGKFYQGGLIFYLDDLDTIAGIKGMVAAEMDQFISGTSWGCWLTDLPNVINVPVPFLGTPPFGPGADIGFGSGNTVGIVGDCQELDIAARVCHQLNLHGFTDWFLPSFQELTAMYNRLFLLGYGNFSQSMTFYWTSSEEDDGGAWWLNFATGLEGTVSKNVNNYNFRAARSFQ